MRGLIAIVYQPESNFNCFLALSEGGLRWKCLFLRLLLARRTQLDAELLALFVEVAALKVQSFGGAGHVVVVPFQFGQDRLTFISLHSVGQCTGNGIACGWLRRRQRRLYR